MWYVSNLTRCLDFFEMTLYTIRYYWSSENSVSTNSLRLYISVNCVLLGCVVGEQKQLASASDMDMLIWNPTRSVHVDVVSIPYNLNILGLTARHLLTAFAWQPTPNSKGSRSDDSGTILRVYAAEPIPVPLDLGQRARSGRRCPHRSHALHQPSLLAHRVFQVATHLHATARLDLRWQVSRRHLSGQTPWLTNSCVLLFFAVIARGPAKFKKIWKTL